MSSPVKDKSTLTRNNGNITLPRMMCLLITAAIFIVGLWPFNFHPPNKVEFLRNENGIRFYGRGIVFSPEPLRIHSGFSRVNSFTIELLVRPNKAVSKNLASMLTLEDRDREQVIFSQWKNNFNIRVPSGKENDSQPFRYVGIRNIFKEETPCLLTVTSDNERTNIYVNGHLRQSAARYVLIPKDNQALGRLILGNSRNGRNPWAGSILGLAIYDRVLNGKETLDHYHIWQGGRPRFPEKGKPSALYLFDDKSGYLIRDQSGRGNHLAKPSIFLPLHRVVLEVPPRERWLTSGNLMDMAVNIVGFVPFGFFLSAWLYQTKILSAPRVYWATLFFGLCVSLSIELTQAYLPSRGSSLLDLINNTVGTTIGVLVFKYVLPSLQKKTE